jgi:aerobic carbon-monoxide dehydrogenase medium subunit
LKPSKFTYHAPHNIDEAISLLSQYDGSARVLAGGQSLIPIMNFRLAAPAALVDLGKIANLAYIREDGGKVRIGAMTRQRSIEFSPLIGEKLPLLREAIGWVGHLPTRSRGTVGGSIAHADPSTEIPMVLQALEGEVSARGPNGERTIEAEDLFVAHLTTALEPDEILTETRFPVMPADAGYAELVEPTSDNNGSAEFRRHLAKVLTGRAVRRAVAMAREKAR